jgi:hypothetical protein
LYLLCGNYGLHSLYEVQDVKWEGTQGPFRLS